MFNPFTLMIPVMVLLPNLLLLLYRPVAVPDGRPKEPVVLVVLERVGQVGTFIIPLFYTIFITGLPELFAVFGMMFLLFFYYVCWIRFFSHGREYRWLYEPFLTIPLPMAVFPVVYFLLASGVTHSLPLLIVALVLAAGHIPISRLQYRHLQWTA